MNQVLYYNIIRWY